MKNDVQFIKDICHLHKLEKEYNKFYNLADDKYSELRLFIRFLTVTYPQFNRKDF